MAMRRSGRSRGKEEDAAASDEKKCILPWRRGRAEVLETTGWLVRDRARAPLAKSEAAGTVRLARQEQLTRLPLPILCFFPFRLRRREEASADLQAGRMVDDDPATAGAALENLSSQLLVGTRSSTRRPDRPGERS